MLDSAQRICLFPYPELVVFDDPEAVLGILEFQDARQTPREGHLPLFVLLLGPQNDDAWVFGGTVCAWSFPCGDFVQPLELT